MIALHSELVLSGAKLKTPGEEDWGRAGSKEKEVKLVEETERRRILGRREKEVEEEVLMIEK